MNRSTFARQWAIIEHASQRGLAWRKRALAHLVAEADATPVGTHKPPMAYRLPDGRAICAKHRYRTYETALDNIDQIAREIDGRPKPNRAYPCIWCKGWHITSQAAR